jgi:hypothetical protein
MYSQLLNQGMQNIGKGLGILDNLGNTENHMMDTALQYGTNLGSDQSSMLAQQEQEFSEDAGQNFFNSFGDMKPKTVTQIAEMSKNAQAPMAQSQAVRGQAPQMQQPMSHMPAMPAMTQPSQAMQAIQGGIGAQPTREQMLAAIQRGGM